MQNIHGDRSSLLKQKNDMQSPLSLYMYVFNFFALSVSAKVPPAEKKIAWVFTVQFGFLLGQRGFVESLLKETTRCYTVY